MPPTFTVLRQRVRATLARSRRLHEQDLRVMAEAQEAIVRAQDRRSECAAQKRLDLHKSAAPH